MHLAAAESSAELLVRVLHRMADNLARLPNYTCLERIERTVRPIGARQFVFLDRLRLEVAYVGDKELYSWPGAEKFEDKALVEIVGDAGTIATGSFALHARAVFRSNAPVFTWAGEGERSGRKTVRYDFQISKEKSRYAIKTGQGSFSKALYRPAGSSGSGVCRANPDGGPRRSRERKTGTGDQLQQSEFWVLFDGERSPDCKHTP